MIENMELKPGEEIIGKLKVKKNQMERELELLKKAIEIMENNNDLAVLFEAKHNY